MTLGANIGTCITALLAATAVSGAEAVPALEIAMVHMLYNVLGVIVIYGIPFLCKLPILGSQTLANVASERKYLAFIYIVSVFFCYSRHFARIYGHFIGIFIIEEWDRTLL